MDTNNTTTPHGTKTMVDSLTVTNFNGVSRVYRMVTRLPGRHNASDLYSATGTSGAIVTLAVSDTYVVAYSRTGRCIFRGFVGAS